MNETAEHIVFGIHAVTTSPTKPTIIFPSSGVVKGFMIVAPASNSAEIYVGNAHVTADQAATGGIPVEQGGSLTLPINAAAVGEVYFIAAGSQVVNFILV